MLKLDCNAEAIDHPTFQFKLTISLGTESTYYFGQGVPGCPEGASWFSVEDGHPMSEHIAHGVRGALRDKAEAALAAGRLAAIQDLLGA